MMRISTCYLTVLFALTTLHSASADNWPVWHGPAGTGVSAETNLVFVLRAGPKFEVLATNSVNESTNASLAASDGEIFLRTDQALWCFGMTRY